MVVTGKNLVYYCSYVYLGGFVGVANRAIDNRLGYNKGVNMKCNDILSGNTPKKAVL